MGLADGAAVATWPDSSGNGYDATQATAAAKPTYKAGIRNGKPVVRFDGGDWLVLSGAGLGLLRNVTGATVIAVLQTALPGTGTYAIFISTGAGAGAARFTLAREYSVATNADIRARRLDADVVAEIHGAGLTAGAWSVATGRVDLSGANRTARLWQSGGLLATSDTFLTSGSTSDTASLGIGIGAAPAAGANAITGDIAELLVWSRALDDGERRRVEHYLGRKYGIAVA